MHRRLLAADIGECTCRGELPPRRFPWIYDNGAYRDWTAGKSFNKDAYLRDLEKLPDITPHPEFIVCPDVVTGGIGSLEFSRSWLAILPKVSPIFLAVQDGMGTDHVSEVLGEFGGIFVGGSLAWKLKTGHQWVELAHSRGMKCHIGRVGTARRVAWARRSRADSIDSCLPLWSHQNMTKFLGALTSRQLEWWM